MPLQNRVTPYGEIVATPERGTLTGNRGVLHGDDGAHRRDWQVRRWIACRLEFKGRRRELRRPGRWTELFFLDEATALAAGHRPCAECRREDYRRWQAAWPHDDTAADAMDRVLHGDRLDGRAKRTYDARLGELPGGVVVERGGRAHLLWGGALHEWSAGGYGPARPADPAERATVLTPACTVETIRRGYAPDVALAFRPPRRYPVTSEVIADTAPTPGLRASERRWSEE
jgi:hypothetical protein